MVMIVKFHHVADTVQAESFGLHAQASRDANAGARFLGSFMSAVVEHTPFGSEAVLRPFLLEVNERALAFAIEQVLECGEREGRGFQISNFGLFTLKKQARVDLHKMLG